MSTQHPTKIETRTRREAGLRGVDMASLACGDLGANFKDELKVLVNEAALWRDYLSSIKVAGVEVELSPETPPLPEALADRVLAADDEYQRMTRFVKWLTTVAGPADLRALVGQVGNRN